MTRSRDELLKILKGNDGSNGEPERSPEGVLLPDGRVITRAEDLPSAVDLAGNDIVARQQAVGDLKAMRAALDAQIAEADAKAKADADAARSEADAKAKAEAEAAKTK